MVCSHSHSHSTVLTGVFNIEVTRDENMDCCLQGWCIYELNCNTFEGDEEDDDDDTAVGRLLLALEVGDLGFAKGATPVAADFGEALCDGSTIFLMSFFCFSASISSYLGGAENYSNLFLQHLDWDAVMGRYCSLKITCYTILIPNRQPKHHRI